MTMDDKSVDFKEREKERDKDRKKKRSRSHDLKKGKKKEGIIFLYFEIYFLFSLIIL